MFTCRFIKPRTGSRLKIISKICKFNFSSDSLSRITNLAYFQQPHTIKTRALLRHASLIPKSEKIYSELEEFETVNKIVESYLTENNDPKLLDVFNWYSEVFRYNLRNGKKNRGTAVVTAYKLLSNDYSASGISSACILGWTVEMLQAFFIIADDIMDESTTRRGELCWYKKPGVGLIAINDALLLQSGVYKILRKHFGQKECYQNLVEAFLETSENTMYGQCLDMLSNPINGKPNYETYTMEKYEAIVEYKTSYYSFCLPVHLAMHLTGIKAIKDYEITRDLCLKLGLLYQIQDDYLDCFGDPKITGKEPSDIKQGKCSWFAVKFLDCADETSKAELMNSYGKAEEESVSKVMHLYEKMNMKNQYLKFEEKLFTEINHLITHVFKNQPKMQDLFYYILSKTYKRQK